MISASLVLDLRLQRDDFHASAVRGRRGLGKLCRRLGKLGFLVGKPAFGLTQRVDLDLEFVLGRAQLILDAAVARFEREDGRGFLAQLDLEPVDHVILLAEIGELARALVLELLDAHFQPPRRHGEFGAQLILVGLDLRHRQRRRGFEPAHGQAHGTAMHERHDDKSEQASGEEAEPEKHDRFDHGKPPPTLSARGPVHNATRESPTPARAGVNLN